MSTNASVPILGIDLGTTNSVVSVADETGQVRVLADAGGNKVQSSVVAFPPSGKVLVGSEARARRVIDPLNTVYSVKRLMGRTSQSQQVKAIRKRVPYRISEGDNQQPVIKVRGGDFAPADISAIILDHMRGIAARQLGSTVHESLDRAVVTVPANFNEAQRSATATAGAIAGLTVVRVLNEPTAAALAYGQRQRTGGFVAVYDLGGGTFDISLLRMSRDLFEVVGTAGDTLLGGDDFDERISESLRRQFLAEHRVDLRSDPQAMMRLRDLAESIKIELSQRLRSQQRIDEIAYGPGGKALTLNADLRREQLEELIGDLVDRTFPVCEEALALAGASVSDITDVVLVGGSTRIPCVRERVATFFRQQPRTDLNPEEAVAMGAALQGEQMRPILDGDVARPGATAPMVSVPRAGSTVTEPQPRAFSTVTEPQSRPGSTLTEATTVNRASPPPVPGSSSAEASAALGRIALKRAGGVRETVRKGAIQEPAAQPSAPAGRSSAATLAADALDPLGKLPDPLAAPAIPAVLDVTPHSLGIATVGGYCERLIGRNARLPVTKDRIFTNARDGQVQVRIRVCQGESRRLVDNTVIGDLVLDGLPARARGQTQIEVSFVIDENGILQVSARDSKTGRVQSARVNVLGAQTPAQVAESRRRVQQLRS